MMPEKLMPNKSNVEKPDWRDYQESLRRSAPQGRPKKKKVKYFVLCLIFLLVLGLINGWFGNVLYSPAWTAYLGLTPNNKIDRHNASDTFISKKQVQAILDSKAFVNLENKDFNVVSNGAKLHVVTSLDMNLQHFLLKHLNPSFSRYIGIVGMDPISGQILSMVGFDKENHLSNPCVDKSFPAASIFKIITASAAVEECGLNLNSKLTYNGRRHTLYKSQLKDRTTRYTNKITFKESFALSVNPVFGKLGAHSLGKTVLEDYAAAFGFNRDIDFEIQVAPSRVVFSEDPYQWAEVASGFNRKTKISPLHGALISSVMLNHGQMVEPTIVDQITDEKGRVLYRSHPVTVNRPLTSRASGIVNDLMETTVRSGTCKSVFKGLERDAVLFRLNIGAKSGSINNKTNDARYDWFVGFAEEKVGTEKLVVSVIVAHEKYIGTRASQYALMTIKQYFRNYFANKQKNL